MPFTVNPNPKRTKAVYWEMYLGGFATIPAYSVTLQDQTKFLTGPMPDFSSSAKSARLLLMGPK